MGACGFHIFDALMTYILAQHEIVLAEGQKCPDVKRCYLPGFIDGEALDSKRRLGSAH